MARALAARGYAVVLHCRASCREAERLAHDVGGGASVVSAALEDPAAPAGLVGEVMARHGRLDVLVNSAASFLRTPLATVTPAAWDEIFAVNLRAPFFLALEAARVMREGASIINMSDLAGFETWAGYIPHGLSKGGVAAMTRSLARELAPRVRVNAIAPGVVLLPDDMDPTESDHLAATTPLRRHGDPQDVVRAMEYLLDATFVTGQVLFVDGGRHVRP